LLPGRWIFLLWGLTRRHAFQSILDGAKARFALALRGLFELARHRPKDEAEMFFNRIEPGDVIAGHGFKIIQTSFKLLELVG